MVGIMTLSIGAFAQVVIQNPGVILDTTVGNSRFVFRWDGNIKYCAVDSVNQTQVPGYVSVVSSSIRAHIIKQRIIDGDTMGRIVVIDIPVDEIATAISNFITSNKVKKAIRAELKTEYKKKLSQE